ncbi:MAG: ATP synthase F1 subunit gamma [Cyanobacteria bacterium SIG30]|nr:ATP synthase F1 subunit gamma [Cyanobacteria bacterium SIG30]
MASLKNIKNRINSIANTQKITKAMKMVAAAKVKKAEAMVKASRPFTWYLFDVFSQVHNKLGTLKFEPIQTQRALDNYVELLKMRDIKTTALLVISSNKGLAGAYSANIARYTIEKIKDLKNKGQKVVVYLIGQKAFASLKNLQTTLDFEIKEIYTTILDDLNPMDALVVSEDLAEAYVNKEIDKIELITTRYQNMMTYKIEDWVLLPALEAKEDEEILKKFHTEENVTKTSNADMIFEPNPVLILAKIVPMYITNVIYQALLEANASELASRMTAMSAATKSAEDMIKTLTVQYNKARQEKITQELTEVISGANALR